RYRCRSRRLRCWIFETWRAPCLSSRCPEPASITRGWSTAGPSQMGERFNLAGEALDARIQTAPVSCQILDHARHARREDIGACRQDARQFESQETQSLPHCNAALEQKGADLIDDASALADQALAHAMQCLQVELVDRFGCDELHSWALHRLGDRLCVAVVVLLTFGIRAHIFCGHQPCLVPKRLQLAAKMMGADTGLHTDQTCGQIGKSGLHLASRPLLP